MRNILSLKNKSHSHSVTRTGINRYQVTSGTSGKRYRVDVFRDSTMGCTCDFSAHRPMNQTGSCGCSHVLAVVNFIAAEKSKVTSIWASEQDAQRQHKSIAVRGDGLFITMRNA